MSAERSVEAEPAGPASGIDGHRILVTGCCGTVGRELVRQLLGPDHSPAEVIGVDNDESDLFFIDQQYLADPRARFALCDMRDARAVASVAEGIDLIFHCAALKHVIMCERSPMEAVNTNIIGVQNVIQAATSEGVSKVIFTSSDKAVNPTNVMGTSKLMGERLVTAANSARRNQETCFASTRFGNVLGSNGSVIPIFRRQIEAGGPVTLTDPQMTRFVMAISEAVSLVIDSAALARGGEVFITKMPVARIEDLAQVMIQELAPAAGYSAEDINIDIIGCKPGEKMYEELMSDEETRRAVELPRYFSILPAFRSIYHQLDYDYPGIIDDRVRNAYVSSGESPLSREELRRFLLDHQLLHDSRPAEPRQRYWPGDKEIH